MEIPRNFPEHFQTSPGNVLDISMNIPGHFLQFACKFPGNFPDISRKCPAHFTEFSRNFPGHSGICPGHFPEISRTCPGNEMSWIFPRFFMEISREFPCTRCTPYSMNSLFGKFFRKFGGVFLEVCETISGGLWEVLGGKINQNNPEKYRNKIRKIPLDTIKYYLK